MHYCHTHTHLNQVFFFLIFQFKTLQIYVCSKAFGKLNAELQNWSALFNWASCYLKGTMDPPKYPMHHSGKHVAMKARVILSPLHVVWSKQDRFWSVAKRQNPNYWYLNMAFDVYSVCIMTSMMTRLIQAREAAVTYYCCIFRYSKDAAIFGFQTPSEATCKMSNLCLLYWTRTTIFVAVEAPPTHHARVPPVCTVSQSGVFSLILVGSRCSTTHIRARTACTWFDDWRGRTSIRSYNQGNLWLRLAARPPIMV